jgi:hypothetical protein
MYLPPVWLLASLGLRRIARGSPVKLAPLGLLWAAHVGLAFSWTSWIDRTLQPSAWTVLGTLIVAAPVIALLAAPPIRRKQAGGLTLTICLLISALLAGTLRWGPAARFEPMNAGEAAQSRQLLAAIDAARSGHTTYPPAHGRDLCIDLTHYYLTKPDASAADIARAVQYAERQTRRDTRDARAWFYLGLAYQRQGRPAEQVRQAWLRSYRLQPTDVVARKLDALEP